MGDRQRPCARGQRCRSAETTTSDDGETITTPALGYGTFCQADRNAIARALAALPELWVRVWQELPVKAPRTERISGSRAAPVPPNLGADALMREILAILASWDEQIRMDASLSLPDTELSRARRQPVALIQAMRVLEPHLDRLLSLPPDAMSRSFDLDGRDALAKIPEGCHGRTNMIGGYAEVTVDLSGADAGEELLALARRCRAFLGETRMVERLDAPCPDPSCDTFTLERVQGSAYSAECRMCGRLLSESELGIWLKLYTAGLTEADIPEDVAERERDRLCAMLSERLTGKAALAPRLHVRTVPVGDLRSAECAAEVDHDSPRIVSRACCRSRFAARRLILRIAPGRHEWTLRQRENASCSSPPRRGRFMALSSRRVSAARMPGTARRAEPARGTGLSPATRHR